jgi:hypothetical protein
MTIFILTVIAGLIVLTLLGMFISNSIQLNSYQTEFDLLDSMFMWAKNSYLISDVEIHSCRMTKCKNTILNIMIENDFVVPEQKDTLRQIIHEDSDERELNVAASIRKLAEEEIHKIKDRVECLDVKVKFDFPKSHKELKSDIQKLMKRVSEFIENMDKNSQKEEENDSQDA